MIAIRKNKMALLCLALLLVLGTSNIYSQEKTKDQKVKRVTVTEEKHDGRHVTTNMSRKRVTILTEISLNRSCTRVGKLIPISGMSTMPATIK